MELKIDNETTVFQFFCHADRNLYILLTFSTFTTFAGQRTMTVPSVALPIPKMCILSWAPLGCPLVWGTITVCPSLGVKKMMAPVPSELTLPPSRSPTEPRTLTCPQGHQTHVRAHISINCALNDCAKTQIP